MQQYIIINKNNGNNIYFCSTTNLEWSIENFNKEKKNRNYYLIPLKKGREKLLIDTIKKLCI